jgi:hypothetical protein
MSKTAKFGKKPQGILGVKELFKKIMKKIQLKKNLKKQK